jgi:hypothetical protein
MAREGKMRHCFYCGAEIGVHAYHDRLDTCGKQECERGAREERAAEREEAHERLARDMGDW